MGFFKNLLNKFKNRNQKLLPRAVYEVGFPTSDGGYASLHGINEQTDVSYVYGNTKLYTAMLQKGDNNGELGKMDKVCFELPSHIPLEQAQDYVQYLVSTVYNNMDTIGRSEAYYHMGVINYDENGQLKMFNPSKDIVNWVEEKLNRPLRENREFVREIKQMDIQRQRETEEKMRQQAEMNHMKNMRKERIEKENRYNEPIFEAQKSFQGELEYIFYQQSDINESSELNGFTTLKKVENIMNIQHRNGAPGYVYSAQIFNHFEEYAEEGFASIYPKVCFELPCPIEQLGRKLQMGEKDVVQTLGELMNNKNLANYDLKTNGEQTWIGRIEQDSQGSCYINNSISPIVRNYINRENDTVRRMNQMGNNSYQPVRDDDNRGLY